MTSVDAAKAHLRAICAEYLVLDDRISEDKLLELLVGAVTKPTSDQPLVIQRYVEGTRAYRLHHTPFSAMTEDDRRLLSSIDDFRDWSTIR